MAYESIAFRIEYKNGAVYHLIASTDVDKMDNFDFYFRGVEYTPYNGLVSLFDCSDNAKQPDEFDRNLFMPHGTARRAVDLMIERLNKLNKSEPIFVTEY